MERDDDAVPRDDVAEDEPREDELLLGAVWKRLVDPPREMIDLDVEPRPVLRERVELDGRTVIELRLVDGLTRAGALGAVPPDL